MSAIRKLSYGAALAFAAAIIPAAAASAATTASVEVGDGTLLAHGAGVSVPVTVTCTTDQPPIYYGYVSVTLTQRQGQTLTQGGNSAPATTCDGTPQTYTVLVTGNRPFKAGAAVAAGAVEVCDAYTCSSVTTSRAISINR
jgi:hypothetical protein